MKTIRTYGLTAKQRKAELERAADIVEDLEKELKQAQEDNGALASAWGELEAYCIQLVEILSGQLETNEICVNREKAMQLKTEFDLMARGDEYGNIILQLQRKAQEENEQPNEEIHDGQQKDDTE